MGGRTTATLREHLKRYPFIAGPVRAAREVKGQAPWRLRTLSRSRAIKRYLTVTDVTKLQIGAGQIPLEGWLNTDLVPEHREVVYLDATKPFPLPDQSFDYILSEHQIEHVFYEDACFMLEESLRILKPGGKIRIATPDLDVVMGLAKPLDDYQRRYIQSKMDLFMPHISSTLPSFAINKLMSGHDHRFVFDEETLRFTMKEAGFVDIVRYVVGDSDDPALRGIERHGVRMGSVEHNRYETLVLEGSKAS